MYYSNRKDDGKFISSKPSKQHTGSVNPIYLTPIAYNKEIQEFAEEQKIGYRDAFIVVTHKDDIEDTTSFIKRAKTRRNGGES